MQLRAALNTAIEILEQNDVGSPRLNAETLLMFVLNCNRAYLYAHPEREFSQDEQQQYDEAIAERARGVPAQYITGHQEFWGLDFIVSPAVLIPRPETEHVVETAVEIARDIEHPLIIDVGTGTGCIALALANELPRAEVHAVDLSPDALEIARANAARLRLERVRFHVTDLLQVFPEDFADIIVSNPPYVGECEADKVQAQVRRFEPHMAVFGGQSGAEIVERLIAQAKPVLKKNGWILIEIGYTQSAMVEKLLSGWNDVHFVPDLQGIPRVAVARKN
ncbi:MAG TPA: peptide chain release factor N(5)-glutamine methyltransferase [Terriglobales bacterium]|nr:peptide chain release factor N(5)-glutamine methyltransferase [Terriglobales bacterium]